MPSPTVLDLRAIAAGLTGPYQNRVLAHINDHVLRMSVMTGPYFWHLHPGSDELFLTLEGVVLLDLPDRRLHLHPGHAFSVPANTPHCTAPLGSRSVNLTLEPANLTTLPTAPPAQF